MMNLYYQLQSFVIVVSYLLILLVLLHHGVTIEAFFLPIAPSSISTSSSVLYYDRYQYLTTTNNLKMNPMLLSMSYDEYDEALESTSGGKRGGLRQRRSSPKTSSNRRRRSPILRQVNTELNKQLEERKIDFQQRHQEALNDPTLLSTENFTDRTDISSNSKRSITEIMGLQTMTKVQHETYPIALRGNSILGHSRTGTGKTLGK